MENNPLQSTKGTKDRPRFLFIFVESLRQGPKVKLNQVRWQRASRNFHLHTTGFETQYLFGGYSFPEWAISVSLHQTSSDDQPFFLLPNCEV
jgi:hypothetical protein